MVKVKIRKSTYAWEVQYIYPSGTVRKLYAGSFSDAAALASRPPAERQPPATLKMRPGLFVPPSIWGDKVVNVPIMPPRGWPDSEGGYN